jgi:hypothetical protein
MQSEVGKFESHAMSLDTFVFACTLFTHYPRVTTTDHFHLA